MASSCLHTFEEYTPQKNWSHHKKKNQVIPASDDDKNEVLEDTNRSGVSKKYLKVNEKSVVLDNIRKPKGVGLKLMSDYTNT